MVGITCQICDVQIETDRLIDHISVEHLNYLPLSGQFRTAADLLQKHVADVGDFDESDKISMDRWWQNLANLITTGLNSDATLDVGEKHQGEKEQFGETGQVPSSLQISVKYATLAAENSVKLANLFKSVEKNINLIRSGQHQVNTEVVTNPQSESKEIQIQRETQTDPINTELIIEHPTDKSTTDKTEVIRDNQVGVNPTVKNHSDETIAKNGQKRLASMSISTETEDLATDLISAKRVRTDPTENRSVIDQADQQSNSTQKNVNPETSG